jgi:hypothetical protein
MESRDSVSYSDWLGHATQNLNQPITVVNYKHLLPYYQCLKLNRVLSAEAPSDRKFFLVIVLQGSLLCQGEHVKWENIESSVFFNFQSPSIPAYTKL